MSNKLTFNLSEKDNIEKFMNLEFFFKKDEDSTTYYLFIIDDKNVYKWENNVKIIDDPINRFVNFLQEQFFVPQVNLEATFKEYDSTEPKDLKMAMKYHSSDNNKIEIKQIKNMNDNDCKNLSDYYDNFTENRSVSFNFDVDTSKELQSNEEIPLKNLLETPLFDFSDFKKGILDSLKKMENYENMKISIHRFCELFELEKTLHKYFSCFDFKVLDGNIYFEDEKTSILNIIKKKYSKSIKEKIEKVDNDENIRKLQELSDNDPNIVAYLEAYKELTKKTESSSRQKTFFDSSLLDSTESEISPEQEFTAIQDILNQLIIDES